MDRDQVMEAYLAKCTTMNAVFEALCKHPYGLTQQELIAVVYKGAHEPDWAYNCICVCCCRFNRIAERKGWSLRVRGKNGPGGKRQIWIVK